MTRDNQIRQDTVDRLDTAISEPRRLGSEPENADLSLRRERMLSTIAAQELRMQELLAKLDTATRLRLLDADRQGDRTKPGRRERC